MNIDGLIKVESQNTDIQQLKGTDFEKLKRRINGICISLNRPADEYDVNKTISSVTNYLKSCKRVIYSEISGYYFSLNEDERGNFIANVEYLLVTCMSKKEVNEEIQQCVLKIYDHVHLAIYQVDKLQSGVEDDQLKNVFAKNLEPVKLKLEDQIQNTYKELYGQLIALIGIFTAMAFLIFGSISSLDNVFNDFQELSIAKILIVTCAWGLSVVNLVFIFMYFVSKMTKLVFEKKVYILVAWSNLILIFIMLLSIWHYYVKKMGLMDWFEHFAKSNAKITSIFGFIIIIGIFVAALITIVIHYKDEN